MLFGEAVAAYCESSENHAEKAKCKATLVERAASAAIQSTPYSEQQRSCCC
jgi:hypothetical protein